MILISHPTGNENVRAAVSALLNASLLGEFDTCLAWNKEWRVNDYIPEIIRSHILKRAIPENMFKKTRMDPWFEVARLLSYKLNFRYLVRHEHGIFSTDNIYQKHDIKVAQRLLNLPHIKAVYAYEDGALNTFRQAHNLQMRCIYELPTGYWRAAHNIFKEEAELNPDWKSTLIGLRDSNEKLARKDQELALADIIFVESSFVKNTLNLAPHINSPVTVVPLGAPAVFPKIHERKRLSGPLKVIYVGKLTQAKGLKYLFDAVSFLGEKVSLTVVGSAVTGSCAPLEKAIKKYNWSQPLPHHKVVALMREHDVLVLPSLFEGFGLVILEAMSQGVPVITTPNTCGPDIIEDGVDGFIVPIRSSSSIAEKLELLQSDYDKLVFVSENAAKKASLYSWTRYGSLLIEALKQ